MRNRGSVRSLTESHRAVVTRPDRKILLPQIVRRLPQPHLPDDLAHSPGHFAQLPDCFANLPEHIAQLPDGYAQLPEHFAHLPNGFAQLPEHLAQLPAGFAHLPEHVAHLPNDFSHLESPIFQRFTRNFRPNNAKRRTLIKNYENRHLELQRPGNVLGKSQPSLDEPFRLARAGDPGHVDPFPSFKSTHLPPARILSRAALYSSVVILPAT